MVAPPAEGFHWPAKALPEYFWWTFSCAASESDDLIGTLDASRIQQLLPHLVPLWERWIHVAGPGERMRSHLQRRWKEYRSELLSQSASEGVGQAVAKVGGFAPPFLSLALSGPVGIAKWTAKRRAVRQLIRQDSALSVRLPDLASETAREVLALARRGLPFIVVVDSAQFMDDEMSRFVQQVACSAAPILVLMTSWAGLDESTPCSRLVRDLERSRGADLLVDKKLIGQMTDKLGLVVADDVGSGSPHRLSGEICGRTPQGLFVGMQLDVLLAEPAQLIPFRTPTTRPGRLCGQRHHGLHEPSSTTCSH